MTAKKTTRKKTARKSASKKSVPAKRKPAAIPTRGTSPVEAAKDNHDRAPLKCVPEGQTRCPHCAHTVSRVYGTTPDPTAGKMRRYRRCRRARCQADQKHEGRFVSVRDMTDAEKQRYGFPCVGNAEIRGKMPEKLKLTIGLSGILSAGLIC